MRCDTTAVESNHRREEGREGGREGGGGREWKGGE